MINLIDFVNMPYPAHLQFFITLASETAYSNFFKGLRHNSTEYDSIYEKYAQTGSSRVFIIDRGSEIFELILHMAIALLLTALLKIKRLSLRGQRITKRLRDFIFAMGVLVNLAHMIPVLQSKLLTLKALHISNVVEVMSLLLLCASFVFLMWSLTLIGKLVKARKRPTQVQGSQTGVLEVIEQGIMNDYSRKSRLRYGFQACNLYTEHYADCVSVLLSNSLQGYSRTACSWCRCCTSRCWRTSSFCSRGTICCLRCLMSCWSQFTTAVCVGAIICGDHNQVNTTTTLLWR